jgi:hypothetical protein
MVSVLASTGRYILQPSIVEMHTTTLEWLSALELWKKEVQFFQKLLDQHTSQISSLEIKKQVDHFQHLITYYGGELISMLRKRLHQHESNLAHMLQEADETETGYFYEHKSMMEDLGSFRKTFYQFKHDYIEFIEHGFSPYSLK